MSKVVLVTGASSGIGKACAEHLAARGYTVYGASRGAVPTGGASFRPLVMDVDDDASVASAVTSILEREGRIDAVINNAGFGYAGAVEDTSIVEAKRQFDTNFFGVLRVCRAALPAMRAAGRGHIVNISSLGGVFGMPFSGLYSATKFALEGMSEALRLELRPFGVHVSLIEPGDIRSNFTQARKATAESETNPAYKDGFRRAQLAAEKDEKNAPPPEPVARLVERVLVARRPRLRYSVGMISQRIVVWLKRLLPARLFEFAIAQAFQIR
jgi:NAD(P)-dependent dehydrogenase (short-subunit alcohol dehydrogenase family)